MSSNRLRVPPPLLQRKGPFKASQMHDNRRGDTTLDGIQPKCRPLIRVIIMVLSQARIRCVHRQVRHRSSMCATRLCIIQFKGRWQTDIKQAIYFLLASRGVGHKIAHFHANNLNIVAQSNHTRTRTQDKRNDSPLNLLSTLFSLPNNFYAKTDLAPQRNTPSAPFSRPS